MVSVGLHIRPDLKTTPDFRTVHHRQTKDKEKKKECHVKRKLNGEMQQKDAFRAAERERMNQPPPPVHTLAFPDTDL